MHKQGMTGINIVAEEAIKDLEAGRHAATVYTSKGTKTVPSPRQEAADAFENMFLSDEEEEEELQCQYIKPNGEQCLRAPDVYGVYCWQHPTRAAARSRTA